MTDYDFTMVAYAGTKHPHVPFGQWCTTISLADLTTAQMEMRAFEANVRAGHYDHVDVYDRREGHVLSQTGVKLDNRWNGMGL